MGFLKIFLVQGHDDLSEISNQPVSLTMESMDVVTVNHKTLGCVKPWPIIGHVMLQSGVTWTCVPLLWNAKQTKTWQPIDLSYFLFLQQKDDGLESDGTVTPGKKGDFQQELLYPLSQFVMGKQSIAQ